MINPLPTVLWSYTDVERETGLRFWELMIPNVEGTGIRLYSAKYNNFVFEAIHPRVSLYEHFNIIEEVEAEVYFHEQSYTLVSITDDTFHVHVSERVSPKTLEDIERIINANLVRWSEDRLATHKQQYRIEWCSACQDYNIHTVEFDRKWGISYV
ncbi:hypothetical protein VPFG_00292 [Vibrio phage nt-1]|uniref:Uncharacterized protein n=1 Tax=Vibrio phage nt-1 TaxID=115992 RepID=R9TES4_9CAUD|nr:hypothetical protein VPFG_00292 [Vibrio phage nt-1]AGN30291.1 hypothetical protein VPFG_00292 [Vibrio phage nt-1]